MDTYKRFPEKLKEVLEELEQEGRLLELKVVVEPSGGGRFVADVSSPTFADIPEELRQNMVWGKILQKLDDEEQRRVEFVFTVGPQEEVVDDQLTLTTKKSTKR